jgi:hypothetical protein
MHFAMCLCRYQQVAKATFEVQAKQQYLKQLEAEAAKLQATPDTGLSSAVAASAQQQPQQTLAQQPQQHLGTRQQKLQQQQQAQGQTPGVWSAQQQQPLPPAAAGGQGGSGMMRVLEGTAQEVYRALLFLVLTIEVYVMSLVPFAGARVAGEWAWPVCKLRAACQL